MEHGDGRVIKIAIESRYFWTPKPPLKPTLQLLVLCRTFATKLDLDSKGKPLNVPIAKRLQVMKQFRRNQRLDKERREREKDRDEKLAEWVRKKEEEMKRETSLFNVK